MKHRDEGFTLIEMVVVVAIIIALAGILVPVVSNELDETKKATAQAAVNRIATAVTQYLKDTSFPPSGQNGALTYHYLYNNAGTTPANNPFASGSAARLEDFLSRNRYGTTNWKGPYLQESAADPWNCRYLVNTHGFFVNNERAWVLSAGPNRTVDTLPNDMKPRGDDIAVFLE